MADHNLSITINRVDNGYVIQARASRTVEIDGYRDGDDEPEARDEYAERTLVASNDEQALKRVEALLTMEPDFKVKHRQPFSLFD